MEPDNQSLITLSVCELFTAPISERADASYEEVCCHRTEEAPDEYGNLIDGQIDLWRLSDSLRFGVGHVALVVSVKKLHDNTS